MMVCQSAPPASAPEPRLTARSMLSFGTELFFAFWIASKRVGLPAGSPPPVRPATSMFLIILANSLPRLASITAFLCLVVAHLEWPDIALAPSYRRLTQLLLVTASYLSAVLLIRRRSSRRPPGPGPRSIRARGDPPSAPDGTRWPSGRPGGRQRSYPRRDPP